LPSFFALVVTTPALASHAMYFAAARASFHGFTGFIPKE